LRDPAAAQATKEARAALSAKAKQAARLAKAIA
jgi:hypothetical protein